MTADRPFAFICYPRVVKPAVAALSESLHHRIIDTWYDTDVRAGQPWRQELADRLDRCSALIVMVAPEIDNLKWLRREIGVAREQHKSIFPVLLPGAGEAGLKALGVDRIQADSLEDGEPTEKWVRSVHDALYPVQPVSAPVDPHPDRARPDRRSVVVAAVAAVAAGVAGIAAGWFLHAPARGSGTVGAGPGECAGKAARIGTVSTTSPGHTGYRPSIGVTVCTAAGPGHSYWLMDYTVGGDGRRFYAKVTIDGSTGTRSYRIVHDKATGVSTSRTYLVLDVPPEMAAAVSQQWTTPDGAPLVEPGADVPSGVTLISNEVPAVL